MPVPDRSPGTGRAGSLVDVLDTGLRKGVTVRGELMLSIADVDLVLIDLRAILASVDALNPERARNHD